MSMEEEPLEKIRKYKNVDEEGISSFEEFEIIYDLDEPRDEEGDLKELEF